VVVDDKNFSYTEESDYQQETLGMKEIVLRHLRKIGDLCCQELTGSYWEKKPMKTQGGIIFTEVYHPDLREAYCNAIDFLIDVLYPTSDPEFKKYIDTNESIITNMDIKEKLLKKRQTFRVINIMFERTNYFNSVDFVNE
jgi:hypothetical protein